MFKLKGRLSVACAFVGGLWPALAGAAIDSDTFQVTATVVSSCDVEATDLNFGSYDPVSSTPLDASTTIQIRCTNGTGYVVSLNAGIGSGASIASRRMTNGASTLAYSLYQDAGRTILWGESAGVDTVAGSGDGSAQTLTVYGRAPAQQAAVAGAFSDTVTVTVTY